LLALSKQLLAKLEDQRDLVCYDYTFKLEDEARWSGGGGRSGIRIDGGFGFVSLHPHGYCTLSLSAIAPTGRGRVYAIIDLRIKGEILTEDHGWLRIRRKKAPVSWYEELPKLIAFFQAQTATTVEVVHPRGPKKPPR
jgi:hypothetical protein